jgi:hypothetical protein
MADLDPYLALRGLAQHNRELSQRERGQPRCEAMGSYSMEAVG